MTRGGACRYNEAIRSKLQSSEWPSILDASPSSRPSRLVPASSCAAQQADPRFSRHDPGLKKTT
jgi:hypothetical protein